MEKIAGLKFDQQGLIPCIVQDFYTDEVLTLAYMNAESIQCSLVEEATVFYSRSRQELWRKGAISGNTQRLVSLTADCDGDALVAKVIKAGPACHTGAESCFNETIFKNEREAKLTISQLYALIASRKEVAAEKSYTSYLFEKGNEKILKKIGEEATEVVIGAMKNDPAETTYEIADLIYHLLVLMANNDIPPQAVMAELAQRQVVDHKVKQETMK